MAQYGSRDLLKLLDIKPHVLRYWEQLLPLVRSDRDESGHRVWSAAQVRMLWRLRHLIVDRGMAVQAAGELLLQEGETAPGNVKARLEALRTELLDALHRIGSARGEAGADDADDGVSHVPGVPVGEDLGNRMGSELGDGAGRPLGAAFPWTAVGFPDVVAVESFVTPPSPETVRSRTTRVHLDPKRQVSIPEGAGLHGKSGLGMVSGERGAPVEIVPVVYRHLFAHVRPVGRGGTRRGDVGWGGAAPGPAPEATAGGVSGPEVVADTLRRILSHRLENPKGLLGRPPPLVVCVPVFALAAYEKVFSEYPQIGGRQVVLLPIPVFRYNRTYWFSPTLGTLFVLLSRPRTYKEADSSIGDFFYLWAADSPDSPCPESRSHLRQTELTVLVHQGKETTMLGESFLLGLSGYAESDRLSLLKLLFTAGKWSVGPVFPAVEKTFHRADIREEGWRYDLWIRDMFTLCPQWFSVPRSFRPTLWRGYDWKIQMPAVWPDIDQTKN